MRMEEKESVSEGGAQLKLRLPAEFKQEIEAVASELHISVSALTRLALVDYLKAHRPQSEEVAA